MPKPSALSALSQVIFCGALILLLSPLQAAGQRQEPEKVQTEIVRPQIHFITGPVQGGAANACYRSAIDFASYAKFTRFAQTGPVPLLNTSNPFNVQPGQTADAVIPKVPNALPPRIPSQQNLCSVPLLRVRPDPSTNYTIRQPGAANRSRDGLEAISAVLR